MNLLGLFGKPKEKAAIPEKSELSTTLPTGTNLRRADSDGVPRPAENPKTVRVHDEFGRELLVPIETWRTQMLPAALQKSYDDPDALYGLIVDALGLGLAADVVPAAAHMYAIDKNAERGTVLYSIVLMKTGHAEVAEKTLSTYLTAHGPSGVVLTNLAKALVDLHQEAEADDALWRGLEADPNQENGLGWYGVMQKERHGEAAWGEAMQRVAALPGAWRPQLWLARLALDAGEKARAMRLYAEALERVERPVPTQVLQQISGDLGNHGLLVEAVALTRPLYDAKVHGLAVGNNLIKAELDLGHMAEARALVGELYLQRRPDWAGNLNYWENEVRKQELAKTPALAEVRLSLYRFDGPVWLADGSAARVLFPPMSPRRATVLFMGSTVSSDASQTAGPQMPDATGRLSRAMPLFLAESAFMRLGVDTVTSIPWVEGGGFAVLGVVSSDEEAAGYARTCGASAVALVHLRLAGAEATLDLRVLGVGESIEVLRELSVPLLWENVGQTATRLSESMELALEQHIGKAVGEAPARYIVPEEAALGDYLLRLEQLLAVRCAMVEGNGVRFLSGTREIVRGTFDMVLRTPTSLPARLILLGTLRGLQKVEPEVAAEFSDQAKLLEKRYPLADADANGLWATGLREIYG